MPTDARAGALEHAPTGVGAAEAERRRCSPTPTSSPLLDEEIASLHEAGRVLASSAPERATAVRRAAGALSALRDA